VLVYDKAISCGETQRLLPLFRVSKQLGTTRAA
jgi:hypothetical protein